MRKVFFILKNLILLAFAFSCSHKSIAPISETNDMFQNGVYKQTIEVTYKKDGKTESNSFNGILKKSSTEIYLYCYVGFGISLFKLKDNFKEPILFVANEERIEKNKDFFIKMYPIIKEILFLKRNDPKLIKNQMVILMPPEQFKVHVSVSVEKIGDIPKVITIENVEHFRFVITNNEFSLLSN
ncbi:MAG: hypothetical protein WA160_15600 [Pseudobdellovibrio sp.]